MLKIIYRELFGFAIKNTFYRNEQYLTSSDPAIKEDFDILLTKNTQNAMKQFGLIYCKKVSGFSVMAQVTEMAPGIFSVAKKINKKTKLTFLLSLKNNGLPSFSEVAFTELAQGKVYYCNNLGINADSRDDLRLSTQPAINAVDDLMRLQTSNYAYEHIGLVDTTAAKIISVDGDDFIYAQNATQNNGKTTLTFDLSPLLEGRYKLEVAGNPEDAFYYGGNQDAVFCVVELFFDGTQTNYQLLESNFSLLSARPQYSLRFQRRKTFWRYILNMDKNVLSSPLLEISDASTTFSKVSPTTKQAVFTSNTLIDLMEDPLLRGSPAHQERIILKDGANEKIGNLPIPNPSIIKAENNQFYSEIIINI